MTVPPLARETEFGREYYNFLTKESAPSVTSILKVFSKPDVERWKLRMAADCINDRWDEMMSWHPSERKEAMMEAHEIYTQGRANVGNLVHEICESLIKGTPVEIPKEIAGYVNQFSKFVMAKRPKWIESEVTVWNSTLGYAGTADAIAEIDGEVFIIDFKSGKGVYPEHGMQLAALEFAEFIIRPDCSTEPLPKIDQAAVLHIRPRSHKLVPVEAREECFKAFCGALELARWKDEVADHVLGEAAL